MKPAAIFLVLLCAGVVCAQQPVPKSSNLVGAKSGSAGRAILSVVRLKTLTRLGRGSGMRKESKTPSVETLPRSTGSSVKQRPTPQTSPRNTRITPSRYVFVYKATIKNTSTKAIKSIDWDYIFLERGTENELGRQQFTSEEKIPAGKTKELVVTITKPPTKTISLTALNNNERGTLDGRVILVRIDYADGTSWQLP